MPVQCLEHQPFCVKNFVPCAAFVFLKSISFSDRFRAENAAKQWAKQNRIVYDDRRRMLQHHESWASAKSHGDREA